MQLVMVQHTLALESDSFIDLQTYVLPMSRNSDTIFPYLLQSGQQALLKCQTIWDHKDHPAVSTDLRALRVREP